MQCRQKGNTLLKHFYLVFFLLAQSIVLILNQILKTDVVSLFFLYIIQYN